MRFGCESTKFPAKPIQRNRRCCLRAAQKCPSSNFSRRQVRIHKWKVALWRKLFICWLLAFPQFKVTFTKYFQLHLMFLSPPLCIYFFHLLFFQWDRICNWEVFCTAPLILHPRPKASHHVSEVSDKDQLSWEQAEALDVCHLSKYHWKYYCLPPNPFGVKLSLEIQDYILLSLLWYLLYSC